jgi:LacI family transcriptional regulator
VGNDNEAIGRIGAEHFLERHFRRFAFVGWKGLRYSEQRKLGFCATLRDAGFSCEIYEEGPGSWVSRLTGSPAHHRRLCAWLARLEAPVALMACNDVPASHVLRACQEVERHVPEEIAVLGADNDEAWCSLAHPPLSSVAVAAEQIGYLAAQQLARLLAGRTPRRHTAVPPLNVVVRQSSDTLAVDNPLVAKALHFIREHTGSPIGVPDVLKAVPTSRRSLERMFRTTLGRSLAEEVRQAHLRRARELIATTELGMEAVARRSGFSGYKHLWMTFRKAMGLTPREYRERLRFPRPAEAPERRGQSSGTDDR